MKTSLKLLFILLLVFFPVRQVEAQKFNYSTRSGIRLGFGFGGSYQQSDIANSRGTGYDFTFGSQLYKREGAFLSADWKFRFLAGGNRAFDHRINSDGSFSNINYQFFSYDVELGLGLNHLLERTRIVVSAFAGAGITHGRSFTDLYDGNNILYDYSGIDPYRERREVYKELLALSDKHFETRLVNRAALLPTAGLFIGYQFSPSFSIGIEHKTNFYLNEDNTIAGINIDNRMPVSSPIDMNHYTSLSFFWKIGSMTGRRGRTERQLLGDTPEVLMSPIVPVTPVIPQTPSASIVHAAPIVEIFQPDSDPYITYFGVITIKAEISNPGSYDNIFFFQEGERKSNFSYNNYSHVFTARAELMEGENHFSIQVKNPLGSAEDHVVVIFERQDTNRPYLPNTVPEGPVIVYPEKVYRVPAQDPLPAQAPLPVVRFISPGSPVTVQDNFFYLRAQTRNVYSRNEVTLSVNGTRISDFDFIAGAEVSARISLAEGVNTIDIVGRNESGISSDRTAIDYRRPVKADLPANTVRVPDVIPCLAPVISLSTPERITTQDRSFVFTAQVDNISTRNQVRITMNGDAIPFNLNGRAVSTTAYLNPGMNSIFVTATNECGSDSRTMNVKLSVAEPCREPELQVSLVAVNRADATHELIGTIRNINKKENITLTVNGRLSEDFEFLPATGSINARFRFSPGTNTVAIATGNDCGYKTQDLSAKVAANVREEESNTGVRINPGNASWQFCMVTTRGTYNRDHLENKNFTYSGQASSLFILPTAGGGEALVGGRTFRLSPGQYYLFSGRLTVTVSSNHPGSMGQWWVNIESDTEPQSGNGNRRPVSPCEGR